MKWVWCTCGWVKREVGCDEVGVVYVWECNWNVVGVCGEVGMVL